MRQVRAILIVIIIAAAAVRFWGLGDNPAGLWCDEAANGYNAYSIWTTGSDPNGKFLPFLIQVHKLDFIESLYTYSLIPFVALLGLNETSIRVASALFGVLTIWSTFLLARKMFGTRVALMACLFLAFSPWHVIYSRFCARPILMPLLITFGLYLFLEGLERPRLLVGAGAVFGISLYTYPTIRVFLPTLLIGFFFIYRKKILQPRNMKWFTVAALLLSMIALPMAVAVISGKTFGRFDQISIFNTNIPFRTFIKNYAAHYTPIFLFITGDRNLRHSLPHLGQELIVLVPFMIVGLIKLIAKKKKEDILLIYWIIIAAIPAALTNEGIPHAGRSFQFIPSLEILAAIGFLWVWEAVGALRYGPWLKGCVTSAITINIGVLIFILFFIYPSASALWWQYGVKEALNEAVKEARPEEPIFITRNIREPYIHVLFHTQKDPRPWQAERSLGRFILCQDDANRYYRTGRGGIYVVRPGEIPHSRSLKTIRLPYGAPVFEIVR